jgi:hypothetical protein
MRTKNCVIGMAVASLLFLMTVPCTAAQIQSVADKSFTVYLYCNADVGDYCTARQIKQDIFVFGSEQEFMISSFDDDISELSGEGEYTETGSNFSAGLEVVDESVSKYVFDITGVSVVGRVILGVANIEYYEPDVLSLDFELEESGTAYFIGLR